MLGYLVAGISFGLSAGFSPGPLLAVVITQTMRYGRKEGIKAAFSPLITDLPIIALTTVLLAKIYTYKPLLGLIAIAGGLFVAYLALENFKVSEMKNEIATADTNSIARGTVVNALSPHPYLFWLTVGGPFIISAYMHSPVCAALFLVSFYSGLIGAKILLAVIVHQSRPFLAGKAYVYTMRILGLLLFTFAIFLFYEGVISLFDLGQR